MAGHPTAERIPVNDAYPTFRIFGMRCHPRVYSLLWAAPYLLFLAFPISSAITYGLNRVGGIALMAVTIGLGATYVASWIFNPVPPSPGPVTPTFVITTILLLLFQGAGAAVALVLGGSGAVYFLTYNVAAWIIQAPRRLLGPGAIGFALIAGVEFFINPRENIFALFIILMASIAVVLSRAGIELDIRKKVETKRALALAEEHERNRISADLHDILGHTLTGISIKADLTSRLLEAGRTEDARTHLDELLDLSRGALTQVRQVVTANQSLSLEEELTSSQALLEDAGATVTLAISELPPAGPISLLFAHIVRESTTNILTHSHATQVDIHIEPQRIEITNNGTNRILSEDTQGGGIGLISLRERAAAHGTLTSGPLHAQQWRVLFTLNKDMR
ncbi:MAG: histidine kinase [Actinobacteria bacterium]|nr:MAG: histidine kinase [Actinomycetota bacterium]